MSSLSASVHTASPAALPRREAMEVEGQRPGNKRKIANVEGPVPKSHDISTPIDNESTNREEITEAAVREIAACRPVRAASARGKPYKCSLGVYISTFVSYFVNPRRVYMYEGLFPCFRVRFVKGTVPFLCLLCTFATFSGLGRCATEHWGVMRQPDATHSMSGGYIARLLHMSCIVTTIRTTKSNIL